MARLSRLRYIASAFQKRLTMLSNRSFHSAAAIQYDDDDYYYNRQDDGRHLIRSQNEPMMASEGSFSRRGVQWVIMGEPRVTKHVYAERLSKLLDVPHIAMGGLLRQELDPRSSLYQQIAGAINNGKLVPEDVIFGLLSKRLEEGYDRGEDGFILDGIPRTRVQAEILDRIVDIDLALNFKCPNDRVMKKEDLGSGSNSCPNFHRSINSQASVNIEQNELLEDYYWRSGKLMNFQVSGAPGEAWKGLLAALHLQHRNAASLSNELITI